MMNPARIEDTPITELLRTVVADARALARVEVELATDELTKQARGALRSGIALVVALVSTSVSVSMLAVALTLALGGRAWVAAVIGGGFALLASVVAAVGYRSLPSHLLTQTRARLRADGEQLREQTS